MQRSEASRTSGVDAETKHELPVSLADQKQPRSSAAADAIHTSDDLAPLLMRNVTPGAKAARTQRWRGEQPPTDSISCKKS